MKRIILAALVGVLVSGPALAEEKITSKARYTITNGIIAGIPDRDPPKITLLLDRNTGQTWMLFQPTGGSIQWGSVSFNPKLPKSVLPPVPATQPKSKRLKSLRQKYGLEPKPK